jgi:nitrous oxidase accessory protein
MRQNWTLALVAATFVTGVGFASADADIIQVRPGDDLTRVVANASSGDLLRLAAGTYRGPIVIDKALTIEGISSQVVSIQGDGHGSVIRILAPDVILRNLHVEGSGTNSTGTDAGIYVEQHADNPIIEGNWLEGNLFGISLHGPKHAIVRENTIANRNDLWLNNRGNGIHMWNNSGTLIESNTVTGGRDGIFVQLGSDNIIRQNKFIHLRFAVHFMYSKRGSVSENISIGNHIGYALMYSDLLKVYGNSSVHDRDYGLMLNSARRGEISGNWIYGTKDKCLFFYLALQNQLDGNRFEGCGVGVHVTGSDRNVIYGNAFIGNHVQMRYAGTKSYEWSKNRRGNYWSDNPAFDLDGDGIADTAYRPNDVVDWIVWRYPLAKMLLSSPAMEILRLGQSQFPALYPGGVIDSNPLMAPPPPPHPLPEAPEDLQWEDGEAEPAS